MATLKRCLAPGCNAIIVVHRHQDGRKKYCSRRCRDAHRPIQGWAVEPGERRSPDTEFKKGNRPQTWVPVGSEAEMKGGYIKVKIAEPNIWKLRSHLVWKAAHGKELPEGWIVRRRDGDPKNDDPENLVAMPRGKHLQETLKDPEVNARWKRRTRRASKKRWIDYRLGVHTRLRWWDEPPAY